MTFKPHKTYRHKNFLDVFIYVVDVLTTNTGSKLKVMWWNYGYVGKPYPINVTQTLDIKDFTGWSECDPHVRPT